ncbi:hypothetical protein V8G54_016011 [Vigna mungo]|uniref:SOSS complex subunit B homolog n=1 Tax=Vigna mungo TaxID=3915 RepID=A0AAQ3NMC1_VIGMU
MHFRPSIYFQQAQKPFVTPEFIIIRTESNENQRKHEEDSDRALQRGDVAGAVVMTHRRWKVSAREGGGASSISCCCLSKGAYGGSLRNKSEMVLLKDIVPAAQNNIETKFIVLEKGSTTLEGKNRICLTLVADETAAVHLQLWGDECYAFDSGDIIHLTKGIFSYQHGNLILRAGKRGKLEKTGEFTMSYVEVPNMSEIHWIPDPSNSKNYIQDYIISPQSRIFPSIP